MSKKSKSKKKPLVKLVIPSGKKCLIHESLLSEIAEVSTRHLRRMAVGGYFRKPKRSYYDLGDAMAGLLRWAKWGTGTVGDDDDDNEGYEVTSPQTDAEWEAYCKQGIPQAVLDSQERARRIEREYWAEKEREERGRKPEPTLEEQYAAMKAREKRILETGEL